MQVVNGDKPPLLKFSSSWVTHVARVLEAAWEGVRTWPSNAETEQVNVSSSVVFAAATVVDVAVVDDAPLNGCPFFVHVNSYVTASPSASVLGVVTLHTRSSASCGSAGVMLTTGALGGAF